MMEHPRNSSVRGEARRKLLLVDSIEPVSQMTPRACTHSHVLPQAGLASRGKGGRLCRTSRVARRPRPLTKLAFFLRLRGSNARSLTHTLSHAPRGIYSISPCSLARSRSLICRCHLYIEFRPRERRPTKEPTSKMLFNASFFFREEKFVGRSNGPFLSYLRWASTGRYARS